jgi:hypothetical protein
MIMSRTWSILGGLLFTSSILYLHHSETSQLYASIRTTLYRQRRKLEDLRAARKERLEQETAHARSNDVPERISSRVKKMWNEDVERVVRRVQNADWRGYAKLVRGGVTRAGGRMSDSFSRLSSEETKKST